MFSNGHPYCRTDLRKHGVMKNGIIQTFQESGDVLDLASNRMCVGLWIERYLYMYILLLLFFFFVFSCRCSTIYVVFFLFISFSYTNCTFHVFCDSYIYRLCFRWFFSFFTWSILPVIICLSQRLSHACLSEAVLALRSCVSLII